VAKRIVGERKFDREHEERWEWILREAIKKTDLNHEEDKRLSMLIWETF
jgi:hypothetical protein